MFSTFLQIFSLALATKINLESLTNRNANVSPKQTKNQLIKKSTILENMKKFIVALVVGLLSISSSFAGENPKLMKEIQIKVKVDLSGIQLEKSKKHYVIVKFMIVHNEIAVLNVKGSQKELSELMMAELKEMFINSDVDPNKVHHFKFSFSQE